MKRNKKNITPLPALDDNYIWLITQVDSEAAIVVDPGEAKPVLDHLAQHKLRLAAILITHHHYDHTGGVDELTLKAPRFQMSLPIYGPKKDSLPFITHKLSTGDTLQIDHPDYHLNILSVPGHTIDHISYYNEQSLFCGDTLFAAGCGRLFEGSAEQLYDSLCQLARLPDHTSVFCAHEYTLKNLRFAARVEKDNPTIQKRLQATIDLRHKKEVSLPSHIGLEKQTNPFLRCHIPEVQQSAERYAQRKLSSPIDVFKTIRAWKDQF